MAEAMGISTDEGLLCRRSALAAMGAIAVGVLSVFLPGGGRSGGSIASRRRQCPMRRQGFQGLPEAGGTILVTENGRGVSAPYGCRLNPVAAEIWRLADGTRTVEDIARVLSSGFGVPYEGVLADTRSFVAVLTAQGLLVL